MANVDRIFAQENKAEVYDAAQAVAKRFDIQSGFIPLEIPEGRDNNWHEDIQRIHDFLIQDIPDDHPIRSREGYSVDRQSFYSLVTAYIRCPGIPKEFIESVIQHRILPDLRGEDKIKGELIRNISDVGERNHQQFFHVLAGSSQSYEFSQYLAASAKAFPKPQDAVEVMAELFTYAQEIDENLFTVLWQEFRHDIGDSPGYDVKMIRSIGDAMVNRFGRLYTLDEQAMLMDSIVAELNDSMNTPRRTERVKAATNRISYYAFRQSKEQLKNLHPNVVGTWFEWVTNQPEQAIEPWTIRFALGMPEEVVDNNKKSTFIDYLYRISLDSVGGLFMKDSKQVDVLLAENEVRVISSIMRDPTTPPEVRQMIETQFIRPILQDFSLDAVNQTDVQEWDEQTYDRAKALVNTLRSFIDNE